MDSSPAARALRPVPPACDHAVTPRQALSLDLRYGMGRRAPGPRPRPCRRDRQVPCMQGWWPGAQSGMYLQRDRAHLHARDMHRVSWHGAPADPAVVGPDPTAALERPGIPRSTRAGQRTSASATPRSQGQTRYPLRSRNTLTRKRPQVQILYRPPRQGHSWQDRSGSREPEGEPSGSRRLHVPARPRAFRVTLHEPRHSSRIGIGPPPAPHRARRNAPARTRAGHPAPRPRPRPPPTAAAASAASPRPRHTRRSSSSSPVAAPPADPDERRHPPLWLHPVEPGAHPQHQLIKLPPPAIQVYAEASGHRTIFCCPHTFGSLGGSRATSTAAAQHDHEVSLE